MKNTNSNNFNYDTAPSKTGTYNVLFSRAKSTKVHEGTAKFVKSKNGWNSIRGVRGPVNDSYDSRDCRIVSPKIVAWAEA